MSGDGKASCIIMVGLWVALMSVQRVMHQLTKRCVPQHTQPRLRHVSSFLFRCGEGPAVLDEMGELVEVFEGLIFDDTAEGEAPIEEGSAGSL